MRCPCSIACAAITVQHPRRHACHLGLLSEMPSGRARASRRATWRVLALRAGAVLVTRAHLERAGVRRERVSIGAPLAPLAVMPHGCHVYLPRLWCMQLQRLVDCAATRKRLGCHCRCVFGICNHNPVCKWSNCVWA